MSLPKQLSDLLHVDTDIPDYTGDVVRECPDWENDAECHLNAAIYKVSQAGKFLHHGDAYTYYDLYSKFKQTLGDREIFSDCLDEGANRIPASWLQGDLPITLELVLQMLRGENNQRLSTIQIHKCLKGQPQLLSKAIASLIFIDTFRKRHGIEEYPLQKIAKVHPAFYCIDGFDKQFFKQSIISDKTLLNELKSRTSQTDTTYFHVFRRKSGTRFFKDLSKKRTCTAKTAVSTIIFLQSRFEDRKKLTLRSKELIQMPRLARFER